MEAVGSPAGFWFHGRAGGLHQTYAVHTRQKGGGGYHTHRDDGTEEGQGKRQAGHGGGGWTTWMEVAFTRSVSRSNAESEDQDPGGHCSPAQRFGSVQWGWQCSSFWRFRPAARPDDPGPRDASRRGQLNYKDCSTLARLEGAASAL